MNLIKIDYYIILTKIILITLIVLISSHTIHSQPLDANHPELEWLTFETEHFIIHYHDGAQRTAFTIAKIAEEIHPRLASLYQYEPDTKFHFIVKDTDDYANGAAYYYNNKMLIWCTALDFDLRGTTNWLRNVITHEYTHIIQLGASRKAPRFLPAFYFQVLDYEYEPRPDVLYGYPNVLASYPVAMTTIPMWFAEGTAQYNIPELRYDYWDSQRDMQLRVRALNDSLLPLNEMEVFGKNSLGNESVYNHGFNLVRYISDRYGAEKLREITRAMRKIYRYNFNDAIKAAIGITGEQLYEDWKTSIITEYRDKTGTIRENIQQGEAFEHKGYTNLYPLWNKSGDTLYFSSNLGQDYFSLRSIYRKGIADKEAELVIAGSSSPFDLSPDGRWLVYSQIVRQRNESYFADLYLYDLREKKKIRLTRSARAMDPSFSLDGRNLVFVVNHDGVRDIAWLELPSESTWSELEPLPVDSLHFLTDYRDGTQCWRPRFNSEGTWIYYAKGRDLGRDIIRLYPYSDNEEVLAGGAGDQRDPTITPDGKFLYYSSDETGIFNLYRLNLETGAREALTNVIGGAFMPSVSQEGKIAYTEFGNDGFELRIFTPAQQVAPGTLNSPAPVDEQAMTYDSDYLKQLPVIAYDDSQVDSAASRSYRPIFEHLFFIPRIAWDYGYFKPGLYVYSSDFLEKIFYFGGVSVNKLKEYDLFSMLEFHPFRPTLFIEGYYIRRVTDQRFDDTYKIIGSDTSAGDYWKPKYAAYGIDYSFNLLELDLGARMRLSTPTELEVRGAWSRYQALQTYEDLTKFHYTYFKGKYIQARVDLDLLPEAVRSNVHPKAGYRAQLTAAFEDNQFIKGFEVNAERYTIQEVYTPYKYWRFETDATTWYNPVGELVLQPRIRAGYLDHEVDSFMYLYAGGLHGMRGYTYYSLGGTRRLIGSLTLRHPLFIAPQPRFAWLHFDGLFAGLFADVGDAWGNRDKDDRLRDFRLDELKTDVGIELRAKLYGWYGFPTAITFTAARGLDRITMTERNETTTYPPKWRYYLTVLFDFETIFPSRTFYK